jgi:hypothetical protein
MLCDRLMLMGCLDQKHVLTGAEVTAVAGEMRQEMAPDTYGG